MKRRHSADISDKIPDKKIPVYNAEKFIDDSFNALLKIEIPENTKIEISVYNDGSTDKSSDVLNKNFDNFKENLNISIIYSEGKTSHGCGYARNQCVKQCRGNYLCLYDVDDIILPQRIIKEYEACKIHPNAIIGCRFKRFPEGSTWHYCDWANNLTQEQLYLQQYRELTIIQPTWFMKREIFEKVGGYIEAPGEDINFFHSHLDLGGELFVVDEILLHYRYHDKSVSKGIPRRELLRIRLKALERRVLNKWSSFSVWGAGRDGKNFVNDLSIENQKKVVCFGDVDVNKINKNYVNSYTGLTIPIVHFSKLKSPFICCVALNRTDGEFEKNVKSLGYTEGVDYYHFN